MSERGELVISSSLPDEAWSATWLDLPRALTDAKKLMFPSILGAVHPPVVGEAESAVAWREPYAPVMALRNSVTQHVASVFAAKSVEERLFDTRVSLKVLTSQYAMYLSSEARARLFAELDYLLAEDGWDPDDTLPTLDSYKVFLKWTVFSKDSTWSSLGISNDGTILAAWARGQNMMTASFGERIRWTQRFDANGEKQIASEDFSLEHFARKATEFLNRF